MNFTEGFRTGWVLKSSLSVGMLAELLGLFVSFFYPPPPHWFSCFLSLTETQKPKIESRIYRQDFKILFDQNASVHPADSRLVSLHSVSADGPLVSGSAGPERCAGVSWWRYVWGQKHLLREHCGQIWMLSTTPRKLRCVTFSRLLCHLSRQTGMAQSCELQKMRSFTGLHEIFTFINSCWSFKVRKCFWTRNNNPVFECLLSFQVV